MKAFDHIQIKDRIAQSIRDEILSGNMEPGEELAQEALAEMLGVSRMPVREALQTLVQEGFAVRLPNRHIQAVVLDDRQIREVFRMVAVMETELAVMAAGNGNLVADVPEENGHFQREAQRASAAESLRIILVSMEQAPNRELQAEYEADFHRQFAALAENPYLEQLYLKIMNGYVAYALENLGDKREAIRHLTDVTEALEKENFTALGSSLQQYYSLYAEAMTERSCG